MRVVGAPTHQLQLSLPRHSHKGNFFFVLTFLIIFYFINYNIICGNMQRQIPAVIIYFFSSKNEMIIKITSIELT